jgi:hypothetical protein
VVWSSPALRPQQRSHRASRIPLDADTKRQADRRWNDLGALKRFLLDDLLRERNAFAESVDEKRQQELQATGTGPLKVPKINVTRNLSKCYARHARLRAPIQRRTDEALRRKRRCAARSAMRDVRFPRRGSSRAGSR